MDRIDCNANSLINSEVDNIIMLIAVEKFKVGSFEKSYYCLFPIENSKCESL